VEIKKVCSLIPSYNEAKTIGELIRQLHELKITSYVVDDGSTDETASIAQAAGAVVLKHKKNMGKGASLRQGFSHVIKKGYDAVLVMDGDGQHKAADVSGFLSRMGETNADIIIGNRMLNTASMPKIRVATNRFMSALVSWMAGADIPDSQCGFRLIKRGVLEKVDLRSSNYEIESEFIIKAARLGFKIESVSVETVYEDEKSKINPFIDTLRFIRLLIRIAFQR